MSLTERYTLGTELYDWTMQLKRRYKEWYDKKLLGTLRPWEEDEINRIADDFLKLTDKII
ncbi:MAG: hypothetical protein IPJ74_15360 [Saprospiraceae bacterium]|nr:hypothetical protein [Saprospiraceae bacterium]